jgi:hypothetical protein
MRVLSPAFLLLLALAGCNKDPEDTDTDAPEVNEGPVLEHTPVASGTAGVAIPITVTATDENGVDKVALFFRQPDQAAWDTQILTKSGDVFTGEIPASDVVAPQIEYYFRAQDASDQHAASYYPEDGASAPVIVPIDVVGKSLPYVQDFDTADIIYDLEWDAKSAGFPGYLWEIDVTKGHSGDQSVGHRRGVDGLDPLDDWLISPPLDFSTLTQIEVSWWEYGDYSDLADHSLWISTTSDDPTEGGFELVAELPGATEDAWGPSAVYDLSAWAGSDAVWLAWHYEGDFTDAWYIDDVTVRELGADLHGTGFGWSPDPVQPGETTTLTLDVENRTTVASGPITVSWTVDPAYASFVTPTTHSAVDATGTASWSTDLTIDPTFPDNSYLPVTIEATDGSRTWTWDQQITVGLPSTAHIVLEHDLDGMLEVVLGAGDPDAPTFQTPVTVQVETAGELTFDIDVTDQFDLLPPAPGENRWWVRVLSASTGQLTSFVIDWDGQSYASDDLGVWTVDTEEIFYLPRPPEPQIVSSSTSVSRVAPGDTVDWSVTLQNAGAPTFGVTTVTLTTSDPDATVLTPDPVQLADAAGWAEGASATADFQVAVAADHYDSTPIQFELLVQDELESWVLTDEIAVPWPLLRVTGVIVDDWATGDDDGLLDDGEKVYLEIDLTNLGDLDTFGSVTCTLSQSGGAASSTIHVASGSFGLLPAGSTKDEDNFQITPSGSVGDDLDMLLSCVDTTGFTYEASFGLVIGEPPWLWISPVDDDCGDAGGYELDLKNGRYRSDGSTLEIEIESCTPFDPTTAFLESWAAPTGADYWYYQLVVQSGVAKLRGYDGAFVTISTPTVSIPDDTHLVVTLDLTTMGLRSDSLPMGFASGFCGGDDVYCDHLPDGWGYPYSVWDPGLFTTLSW